jgi:hypothetical protein
MSALFTSPEMIPVRNSASSRVASPAQSRRRRSPIAIGPLPTLPAILLSLVNLVALSAAEPNESLTNSAAATVSESAVSDLPEVVALSFDNGNVCSATKLHGSDARLQLIVTGMLADGQVRDLTRSVTFAADPAEAVQIDATGLVVPLADAAVKITASLASVSATSTVEVTDVGQEPAIHFPRQIVPVFTKLGCNGGGCHGKIAGQNGFRLSLLGFEPQEDYDFLVKESRGRRLSPAMPQRSLLLTKATNDAPHGGGQRLHHDSYEYRLLSRWIQQGMPYGDTAAPAVAAIEVFPAARRLPPGETQQLSVIARYSDGVVEDVTRAVVYESNDPSMAEVSSSGLVQLHNLVGDVAIMARFQGHVAVFTADVPLPQTRPTGDPRVPLDLPQPNNLVDVHVFDKLRSLSIPTSPSCDDATYLRRATLDISGRLPTLAEVQSFAADNREDKRMHLVDRLLDSDDYAEYFAGKWSAILRNRRTDGALQFSNLAFHQWIRESLSQNKPYDKLVRELITASGSPANNPAVIWYAHVPDTEQRTEDAAQLFLGQRIQCARCHHHPYEKWSQADYAALAAYFSLVTKKPSASNLEPEFHSRSGAPTARHPKTGQAIPPAGLDAPPATVAPDEDPREQLVDWMVHPDNPFFARALVNRYWKHFMGRGLVEPEDDLRVTNPPSNPALLDAIADEFVRQQFDLKSLIRLICQSRTYAHASDAVADNLDDRRSHSRFYPKRLSAEVLLDAVDTVTENLTAFAGMPPGTRAVALPDTGFASYFLSVFGQPRSTTACECERSQEANLAQSLHLLNSAEIQAKLSADDGRAARLAADESRSDDAKVDELYQLALARLPSDAERKAVLEHLQDKTDRRAAMEDIVWSLINSKEFLFNH